MVDAIRSGSVRLVLCLRGMVWSGLTQAVSLAEGEAWFCLPGDFASPECALAKRAVDQRCDVGFDSTLACSNLSPMLTTPWMGDVSRLSMDRGSP